MNRLQRDMLALDAGRAGFNSITQPVDVSVYRVFIALMVIAPNSVKQLCPAEYAPSVASKMPKQIKLSGGKLHFAPVYEHPTPQRVYPEPIHFHFYSFCLFNRAC